MSHFIYICFFSLKTMVLRAHTRYGHMKMPYFLAYKAPLPQKKISENHTVPYMVVRMKGDAWITASDCFNVLILVSKPNTALDNCFLYNFVVVTITILN